MATARKTFSVDVLELLTSQHAEVDDLLEKLENDEGDREELFTQLADKLAAHAAIEEKIFYPAALEKATEDQLHEAVEEHLAIKRVLADLITKDVDDATFKAKLSVLKETVSHHAHEEEEAHLFPKLRRLMNPDERAAIGNECLAKFEELMAQGHPMENVPGETADAAPLPELYA